MDAKLIEKLDRRRYKYRLWQTILLGLSWPVVILHSEDFGQPLLIAGHIGFVLSIATLIAQGVEFSKIKKNPELKAALNDELYVLYGYKSMLWAYVLTIVTVAILLFLFEESTRRNWTNPLTGRLICGIIIYVSCMTSSIAKLIYMRK